MSKRKVGGYLVVGNHDRILFAHNSRSDAEEMALAWNGGEAGEREPARVVPVVEVTKLRAYKRLEKAAKALLAVSHCKNGCPPSDKTCASRNMERALAALKGEQ